MNLYEVTTKVFSYTPRGIRECREVGRLEPNEDYYGQEFVYANSPAQARYLMWRDVLARDTRISFRDAMRVFKSTRLIARNLDHQAAVGMTWDEGCKLFWADVDNLNLKQVTQYYFTLRRNYAPR